ncbi:MAG: metallophosphoesterase [Planctomycetes bacterium]|nr:metallophosphoesterase [Planctomycetota bacterium]
MQPAFVVAVGDLIEGYTKDQATLGAQWKEFQGFVHKLQMPFFYVPGNHDLANAVEAKEWEGRFGRRFYHFLYRDVLFLALNSDDPHEDKDARISKEQIDFVQKTLKENAKARWTVVFLHKPMWVFNNLEKSGWLDVEKALEGRNYTVFAGHVHRYRKFVRQGMNYYQLATTGGGSKMRGLQYGEFDHVVWVTMRKDGPVIANLMLDGIYSEDLKKTYTAEDGVVRRGLKSTYPVHGKVSMDGTPLAGAHVIFYFMEDDPKKEGAKKYSYTGDAFVEPDGSFILSTYQANDGAPVGEYAVAIELRDPYYDGNGNLSPNRLPERYATAKSTDLRAKVKAEPNDFSFNLSK